jgi:hypothetical protein
MEQKPEYRPGDQILDRYVPHLTGTDRELARERLQGLARIMLTIAMRKVREDREAADSHDSDSRRIITPTP